MLQVSRMLPSQKLDGWARALVAPEASAAKAKQVCSEGVWVVWSVGNGFVTRETLQAASEVQVAESAATVSADTPVVPIASLR